jgi:hypothetical protein
MTRSSRRRDGDLEAKALRLGEQGRSRPERPAILWEALENHTAISLSLAFQQWRAIVGGFFATPPTVEHFTLLAKSA